MTKSTFLLTLVFLFAAFAQVNAQSYKYPLFEHFTQASCGPCATQNPSFQATILEPNPNSVRHIAYHTSWPGFDPMYNANTTQSADRVNFYGVSGVPDIFLQGNFKEAQPGGMTMSDVNSIVSQTSPVKITVQDVDNGTSHDVNVTIRSVGTPPAGTWNLVNVVIERNVNYANPPGNNGEKYFPNVMRKIVPSSNGVAVTLPALGSESTFSYTYDEDAAWNMDEIGVVSFLQNSPSKEILNAGSSFDEVQNALLTPPVTTAKDGLNGVATSFDFNTGNGGNTDEDFIFTLTSDAPADWSASFTVNGTTASLATIIMTANSSLAGTIDVTPGPAPAFATYSLSIAPANNPNAPAMLTQVYVISGVTDLIVNNAAGNGVTPGDAATWQAGFVNGLNAAGSTTYDVVYHTAAQNAFSQGAMVGVKHL
ncbi:MAG: Omp28-related outer membrane protein, partial [Chitinophagales bacterium]